MPPGEAGRPRRTDPLAHFEALVAADLSARGDYGDPRSLAANVAYNTIECRRRAELLAEHVARAHGFSLRGAAIGDFGCGYGGLSLCWALEHGAGRILAVDQTRRHVAALHTAATALGLAGVTVLESDLQAIEGFEESLDLVVLSDVLYTANLCPGRVAAVCARLLRPGGLVLFRHVNRAHGSAVVSHRDGTQFLDPDSADRAARFLARGSGSTRHHRPLSPCGLAAFLRRAGFGELYIDSGPDGRNDARPGSDGLAPRYLLSARRTRSAAIATSAPPPRIAPPPAGLFDLAPFHAAIGLGSGAVATAAEQLCRLFGGGLGHTRAAAALDDYLLGRLLLDGLRSFHPDGGDEFQRGFARASRRALDHALAAVLTREAGWTEADFAAADAPAFAAILARATAAAAEGFVQPVPGWTRHIDWRGAAARVVETALPGSLSRRRGLALAARLLPELMTDRQRLGAAAILARAADPVTGSFAAEYAEAALDRLYAELRAAAGWRSTPRPLADPRLAAVVEEIEAEAAHAAH